MSKTKMFSKHTIFIVIIVVVIIFGIYCFTMKTREYFDNDDKKKQNLAQALMLSSKVNLPDDILAAMSSVPTLTPNLAFSNIKEAFYGMGDTAISNFANSKSITSTKNWDNVNLTSSNDRMEIMNRPKQPIPLPEGELDMFATTQFKPECCPNSYSNSMGCACMTTNQYKYLVDRGGNNVPYSVY